ncbi:hypothetical protein [Larkinella arboricola]|nr:hypothetical protein [Larkinella arboricola]
MPKFLLIMLHAVRFLLVLFVLAGFLITCKRTSDKEIAPETELKILELHLAGIADKNISIDHAKRLITIQMPPMLPSINLKATYKLGRNARLVRGAENGFFDIRMLNKCFDAPRIGLTKADSTSDVPIIEYSVVAVTSGKLTATLKTPIEHEQTDVTTISIPVENLYGSETVVDALVTREGSSEKISLLREPSPVSCGWFTTGSTANQIDILTSRQLQPGRYTLELVQANGTVVPVPQPLLVKKGIPSLRANLWRWGVLPNEPFQVVGYNLFEEDISLTIKGKDKTYQPTLTDFSNTGTEFRVITPDLAPGNYFVKVNKKNGDEVACLKVNVLRHKGQPVLMSISETSLCMNFEAFPLSRGTKVFVNYTPATAGRQPNPVRLDELLQFTRIGAVPGTYNIPINLYQDFNSPAYFILPDSIPAGRYEVKLQVKNPETGKLSLSETYERMVEVR